MKRAKLIEIIKGVSYPTRLYVCEWCEEKEDECMGCGHPHGALSHAWAALRHIARVCEDPTIAEFAFRAAMGPPIAFAPVQDYGEKA